MYDCYCREYVDETAELGPISDASQRLHKLGARPVMTEGRHGERGTAVLAVERRMLLKSAELCVCLWKPKHSKAPHRAFMTQIKLHF